MRSTVSNNPLMASSRTDERRDTADGKEAEDLPDILGLFRAGHRRALDEGRFGGVGCGQQSLPPRCRQGEHRSGRHCGDHGEAWRGPQAPRGIRGILRRTCRTAEEPRPGRTEEGHLETAGPKAKKSSGRPDKATVRKAAQAYERERQRSEREEARDEAARQKKSERRQQAVNKAQATLEKAEEKPNQRARTLRAEIESIEKKLKADHADWNKEEERLKVALRRARD
jgi:hypothetical protein